MKALVADNTTQRARSPLGALGCRWISRIGGWSAQLKLEYTASRNIFMRTCCVVAVLVANLVSSAHAQVQDAGSSEIRKQWVLGEHLARDLDEQAGRVYDVPLLDYLRRIETRITGAIGANPVEIRVTRSSEQLATLLPNGVLYLSSGILARIESESELAGAGSRTRPFTTPQSRGFERWHRDSVAAMRSRVFVDADDVDPPDA